MTLHSLTFKYNFTMYKDKQQMIAKIVKEQRIQLNYTQKDLADISNISLRSIQRIEKGEVTPRISTLKILSKFLNFTLDDLDNNHLNGSKKRVTFFREVTISILLICIILLIATAYIAQSKTFPETDFELLMYYSVVNVLLGVILIKLWKNKKIGLLTQSKGKVS